ncbi:MAG: hypothetical protein ACE5J7_00085 [Candidatus Aenigmatarchaeota archaeon]
MPIVPKGWDWQYDWHKKRGYWVPEGWEFQPDYSFLERTNWGFKEPFKVESYLRRVRLGLISTGEPRYNTRPLYREIDLSPSLPPRRNNNREEARNTNSFPRDLIEKTIRSIRNYMSLL